MAIRHYIVGNWKMNGSKETSRGLVSAVETQVAKLPETVCTVLCPPLVLIPPVQSWLKGRKVQLGAQDCHAEPAGAFTGDCSAAMVKDASCEYVILGHSERRMQHGETDPVVSAKADAAIRAGLIPIVCVGEAEDVRRTGVAEHHVSRQLLASLPDERQAVWIVAYEPIWAIGTGKVATPQDIAKMHHALREVVLKSRGIAPDSLYILYGGSVKAENAAEILNLPDVGGVLVGGASLDSEQFGAILAAAGK